MSRSNKKGAFVDTSLLKKYKLLKQIQNTKQLKLDQEEAQSSLNL